MATRATATTPEPPPDPAPVLGKAIPRVRKDTARNRAHLLQTADRLIAERGLGITLHELAAAAGVGVGTVYRHFADLDELIGAFFQTRVDQAFDVLIAADRLEDPIDALRAAVYGICELQQHDRGLWEAMASSHPLPHVIARERLGPITIRIVERANASGRVRGDLYPSDLPMMFWLSGALSQRTVSVRPDLWRRYMTALLSAFIDGTGDPDPAVLAVPALTGDELERVLDQPTP